MPIFVAKKCGHIFDIPLSKVMELFSEKQDFVIDEVYVNIKGVCKTCKA
jgi:Fur family peroxide stress response transcriptional regulator